MIRKIITPKTNTVTLELPESYIGKRIEILAFSIVLEVENIQKEKSLNDFYSDISIDLKSFHFDREAMNER